MVSMALNSLKVPLEQGFEGILTYLGRHRGSSCQFHIQTAAINVHQANIGLCLIRPNLLDK